MIAVSRPFLGPEELAAVGEVFDTGWLGLGSTTLAFENALKEYLGARNVVAVNTGTSALHLALAGFEIGPGDEVIVPSITFAACIQAIIAVGATPVFCESREDDILLDLDDVERRITSRTRAIMPVHYCGNPCDMDRLLAMAQQHQLWIVEDAAHALGSTYKGRRIGSFGHATCFSFDPIKNITCGEGGAVVLADDRVAEQLRQMRILGMAKESWHRYKDKRNWYYEVTTPGFRYHMPNFCAAVGLVQMGKLDQFVARRRAICRRYDIAFRELASLHTLTVDYDNTAPHIYVVRVPGNRREAFMGSLKEAGVDTGIHYLANHLQPYFTRFVSEPLPVATRLSDEIVTLPLHFGLSDADVDCVIAAVVRFDEGA